MAIEREFSRSVEGLFFSLESFPLASGALAQVCLIMRVHSIACRYTEVLCFAIRLDQLL